LTWTAVAAVAAIPAATAAAPGATFALGPRFINGERSAINFLATQFVDGALAFVRIGHFDKCEASRFARIPVGGDTGAVNSSKAFKERPDILLSRPEAEVSYKYVFHDLPFLWI
jgi:hypothetical protein